MGTADLDTLQAEANLAGAPRMLELPDNMVAVAHPREDRPRVISREQFISELAQTVIDRLETQAANNAIRRLFGRSKR